jgi:DNA ligase 1
MGSATVQLKELMKAPTLSVKPEQVKFPTLASPKLDGLRGAHFGDSVVSKTLKRFRNEFTHELYARTAFTNFDGELVVGLPYGGDVIRRSYSGVMSRDGVPDVKWFLFDDFTLPHATFKARQQMLMKRVHNLPASLRKRVEVLEQRLINSLPELLSYEADMLRVGYEGLMLRDPMGPYVGKRCTLREGWLLKFKRFEDKEAIITGFEEGSVNENERKADGKRRTLRAGLRPSGMVGTILAKDVESGEPIRCAPGRLTHDERIQMMLQPKKFIGMEFTYRRFPTGTYAAPRFPTFQTFRNSDRV